MPCAAATKDTLVVAFVLAALVALTEARVGRLGVSFLAIVES